MKWLQIAACSQAFQGARRPFARPVGKLDRQFAVLHHIIVKRLVLSFVLLGSACFHPYAQTLSGRAGKTVPPPSFLTEDWQNELPGSCRYAGKFKVTYYWAVEAGEYPQKGTVPIYLADGSLLGRFAESFVAAFKTESAAELPDGRKISYLKKMNRAKLVDRFLGTRGYTLTDLKSIAVDPRVIPIGSVVYIPQAENVVIDGKRHNGIFYAHDIGSAIRGKHIDIFVGKRSLMSAFVSAGLQSSGSVDVYILE